MDAAENDATADVARAYRVFARLEARGRSPRYDGRWRDRDPKDAPAGVKPAIRLKAPQQGDTVVVSRHFVVKGILFSKDAYPAIRAVFGYARTHDGAQILFEPAQAASGN